MFDRGTAPSRSETDTKAIHVRVELAGGVERFGIVRVPADKSLDAVLAREDGFLRFEHCTGEPAHLGKKHIVAIEPFEPPACDELTVGHKRFEAVNPYDVLGVREGASLADVRAAYLAMAKKYHPDHYAQIELPSEVAAYFSSVARRLNLAYDLIEERVAAAEARARELAQLEAARAEAERQRQRLRRRGDRTEKKPGVHEAQGPFGRANAHVAGDKVAG